MLGISERWAWDHELRPLWLEGGLGRAPEALSLLSEAFLSRARPWAHHWSAEPLPLRGAWSPQCQPRPGSRRAWPGRSGPRYLWATWLKRLDSSTWCKTPRKGFPWTRLPSWGKGLSPRRPVHGPRRLSLAQRKQTLGSRPLPGKDTNCEYPLDVGSLSQPSSHVRGGMVQPQDSAHLLPEHDAGASPALGAPGAAGAGLQGQVPKACSPPPPPPLPICPVRAYRVTGAASCVPA